MQVKWSLFPFLLFILFLYALPASGRNESNGGMSAPEPVQLPRREREDDSISFGFGFYRQDDGSNNEGGNFNIDEDETVYEAIIMLDKTLNDRDRLNVRFLGDLISSASQSRFHNPQFRALQSNPSGNEHFELRAGWNRLLDDTSFGFNGSFGAERSSYYSWGYGGNFAKSFREAHTNLSFLVQGYTDYFQIKLFDGTEPGYDIRQTVTGEIGLTQILSRRTIANLTFHHTHQLGFLATTFNSVFINGVEFSEEAPSKRRRNAITARIKQALWETAALELGYRFYNDSWELNSHTLESRLFQYLGRRRILLEPNYRFYIQDAAFFYQPEFTQELAFRTSDPDLGNFRGHILGLRASLLRLPFPGKWTSDISLGFNYYLRNDGLDIYWIEAGYVWRF